MSSPLRKVLVIVGTTGAGKTKLSIEIAKAVGGEIVNSDAMQMYRGLDIATAKITEQEKEGIPHHLFDIVDPSSRCDVLDFKKKALSTIDEIFARGNVPIIVGGTMYYTQSILWKAQLLDDIPTSNIEPTPSLADPSSQEMFDELQRVDPEMASRLHVNNVRKVQRSLEVYHQTGRPHSELLYEQQEQNKSAEKYFDACALWVHCRSREVLRQRLETRVDSMVEKGIVDEVRSLREQVRENPPTMDDDRDDSDGAVGILQAIGYKEFAPYLEAEDGRREDLQSVFEECKEELNTATWQYARRQLSWLRNRFVTRNIPVYEFDSTDVSDWEDNVHLPAVDVARSFLEGRPVANIQSVQEQNPEMSKERTIEEKHKKYICDICLGRELTGVKEWESHLRSKGHKYHVKRIAIEKKKQELDCTS